MAAVKSNSPPNGPPIYKVVLVGEAGVGKSSIFKRYRDGIFIERITSTLGLDKFTKDVDIGDERIKISLWDTAGMERGGTLTSSHFNRAHGILLVYSIDDLTSLSRLSHWKENALRYAKGSKMFLVGNKVDLDTHEQEVKDSTAEGFAGKHEIPTDRIFRISAKTEKGFSELFTTVGTVLKKETEPSLPHINPFRIDPNDEKDGKKSGCCR